MTYAIAFPDFQLDVAIPADWTDASYKNDTCPCWQAPGAVDGQFALVHIDYADSAAREFLDNPRFNVYARHDPAGLYLWVYGCDDWNDAQAAVAFVRALPDLQALANDDQRALAALSEAVDVPGSWYGDTSPAHAIRDRIEAVIQENAARFAEDAAYLRADLATARTCGANGLHALSVQYMPVPVPDDMDEAEARPIVVAAILARAADLGIPAHLIGV